MFALLFSLLLSAHAQSMGESPTYKYLHLYTDADGISRIKHCELKNFKAVSRPEGASKLWIDDMHDQESSVSMSSQPLNWQGMWHEDAQPQWLVTLTGHWYVTTMDGQKVELGPGDIAYGEDQNTKEDARGYRGHMSGTVGAEPATVLVIKTHARPVVNSPCRFK